MHVRIVSFGSNWWEMHSRALNDPLCFRRKAAWFNSAALRCGRRIRYFAAYPGQIRFNLTSGFNPEFPLALWAGHFFARVQTNMEERRTCFSSDW